MNDYNELIERCKEILEWKKTGLLKGDALLEYTSRQHYADSTTICKSRKAALWPQPQKR